MTTDGAGGRSGSERTEEILRRLARETGTPDLTAILTDRLAPADLHSLLLHVQRTRSARLAPAAVLADFASNRFVAPASVDPRRLLAWDRVAFGVLPPGFDPLELSPVAPLGVNATVASVSQDKSLTTIRNLEVVSDATNVLALAAALRRRVLLRTDPRSAAPVHLAASHRVTRAQRYENPAFGAHFRLFSLCSAGRDRGARRFELATLRDHLRFHVRALRTHLGHGVPIRLSITDLSEERDAVPWLPEAGTPLETEFPAVEAVADPDRTTGRGYYRDVCFKIHAQTADGLVELSDGGCVDWTAKLLDNAKERLLISAIGSERVCGLAEGSES